MAQNTQDRLIKPYELKEQIGIGGMGTVYRGIDPDSGKSVAIKILRPEIVDKEPDVVERFTREAEALRQLDHPNIVKVLNTYIADNKHHIVMEFAGGGSLLELIRADNQL